METWMEMWSGWSLGGGVGGGGQWGWGIVQLQVLHNLSIFTMSMLFRCHSYHTCLFLASLSTFTWWCNWVEEPGSDSLFGWFLVSILGIIPLYISLKYESTSYTSQSCESCQAILPPDVYDCHLSSLLPPKHRHGQCKCTVYTVNCIHL